MQFDKHELKEMLGERKPIFHVQNIFIVKPLNIYIGRETEKYLIGYELKSYSVHRLVYKLEKKIISEPKNPITFGDKVDINVQEDYRLSIKTTDTLWKIRTKNVTMRITPTRYNNLQQLYGIIYRFGWRHTGAGGRDYIQFKIKECPIIANSENVNDICYKLISSQISSGGTHGTHTYIILARKSGEYELGKWIKISNKREKGGGNRYEYPVSVSL